MFALGASQAEAHTRKPREPAGRPQKHGPGDDLAIVALFAGRRARCGVVMFHLELQISVREHALLEHRAGSAHGNDVQLQLD